MGGLTSQACSLIYAAVGAFPTCLQRFASNAIGGSALMTFWSIVAKPSETVDSIENDAFTLLMQSLTRLSPPPKNAQVDPPYKMPKLLNSQAMYTSATKFINCTACAIRFGRQSCGVIEACVFEDCGSRAIVVDSGAHPVITGCRFLRTRESAIVLRNFADPLIVGNEIAKGLCHGIEISSLSRGVIALNVIAGHGGAGISVAQYSSPLIMANAIWHNTQGGVCVRERSRPVVLHNYLLANSNAHLHCRDGADPCIAFNYLLHSTNAAMIFTACSVGTVFRNILRGNGEGIIVELDADPHVEGNRIEQSLRSGVVARNNALGTFIHNEFRENTWANVEVLEGASPVFRGNAILHGGQGGVAVHAEGSGYFEKNSLTNNAVANVLVVDAHSDPFFVSNNIGGSDTGYGVLCSFRASGSFVKNAIHGNKKYGVCITHAANPTLRGNHISRSAVGVFVSEAGKGRFDGNVIDHCLGSGVLVQCEGEPLFENNSVKSNAMVGISVSLGGLGRYTGNVLESNDIGLQLGSSMDPIVLEMDSVFLQGKAELRANKSITSLLANEQAGEAMAPIELRLISSSSTFSAYSPLQAAAMAAAQRRTSTTKSATCRIVANKIHHNRHAGVLLDTKCSGIVEGNEIYLNAGVGFCADTECLERKAQILLENPPPPARALARRKSLSFSAIRPPPAIIIANTIHSHTAANVDLCHWNGEGEAQWLSNDVFASPKGFYVRNQSSNFHVQENRIHDCLDGVYVEGGGKGLFSANHIYDCVYSGLYVCDLGEPSFTQNNRIEQCGLCGILVDRGGKAQVSHCIIRRCRTGIVVFCAPAVPFHISYADTLDAGIPSSSPVFEDNTIEENEVHGVLLLSIVNGSPLRMPRNGELPSFGGGADRLGALFMRNTIQRNRIFGVYFDQFEHWELDSARHGERVKPANVLCGKSLAKTYSSYEAVLGTSPLHSSVDHKKERELKQVTFCENIIRGCSAGFVASAGCHPFLLRNRMEQNHFFGLMLRFGSAVMSHEDTLRDNGIAGVYAARGAKGVIAQGAIGENNGCCRTPTQPEAQRHLSACIFNSIFYPTTRNAPPDGDVIAQLAPTEARGNQLENEQLMLLIEVHQYVLSEAVQLLWELVSASSKGIPIATGCCPSALLPNAAISPLGGSTSTGYVRMCTADGGIGAWIEEGSRLRLCGNRIEGNRHIGVLFSTSAVQHHRMLCPRGATRAAPAQLKEGVPNALRQILSLPRPALASTVHGAFFMSYSLCVPALYTGSGADTAAVQKLALLPPICPTATEVLELPPQDHAEERADATNCACIAGNTIRNNDYGIYIQQREVLQAAGHAPAAAAAATAALENDGNVVATALTPRDQAILRNIHVAELSASSDEVGFALKASENTVTENGSCGIYCEHIVEVRCGEAQLACQGALINAATAFYQMPPPRLLFRLTPAPEMVSNVLISQNRVVGNPSVQGEISARYVAVSADQAYTLLQFDTRACAQTSNCASTALLNIDLFASLLQHPPPGLCLWHGNILADANYGMRVLGYVGSTSARLQHNTFENLKKTGLVVEGHLAACTVGEGNVFRRNGTSVLVQVEPPRRWRGGGGSHALRAEEAHESTGLPMASLNDLRTRLFGNTFESAGDCSILAACTGDHALLLCHNAFINHGASAIPIFLSTDDDDGDRDRDAQRTLMVDVVGNLFSHNHTALVVTGKPLSTAADAASPSSSPFSSNIALLNNFFTCNTIGALACRGATPIFARNIFKGNCRCGLEINGCDTAPQVRDCVFSQHGASPSAPAVARQGTSLLPQRDGAMPPRDNDRLVLRGGALCIDLVPRHEWSLEVEKGPPQCLPPVGLVLDARSEGLIEGCVFVDNDIGVDIACASLAHPTSTSTRVGTRHATLHSCVFRLHRLAGVLLREWGVVGNSHLPPPAPDGGGCLVPPGPDGLDSPRGGAVGPTVQACHFANNRCNASTCGDVVIAGATYATLRQNVFFGVIHGRQGGQALLEQNFFFGQYPETTLQPEGVNCPTVLLHSQSTLTVQKNTFASVGKGVIALSDARGYVQENLFADCATALTGAPFSSTTFFKNQVLASRDCALLAFGGLFFENEVYLAPTGLIVQPAAQYKDDNAVPAYIAATGDKPMCSRNTIAACKGDGVLVAGLAHLEGNKVSNCQNGFHVIFPSSVCLNDDTPLLLSNAAYDNQIGCFVESNSIFTLRDNDIFDNEVLALCVVGSAKGVLRDNRLSSALEYGAVQFSPESNIKSNGNVIHNRFSPAFNRGTRVNRSKEFLRKLDAVKEEVAQANRILDAGTHEARTRLAVADALVQELEAELRKRGSMRRESSLLPSQLSQPRPPKELSGSFPLVDKGAASYHAVEVPVSLRQGAPREGMSSPVNPLSKPQSGSTPNQKFTRGTTAIAAIRQAQHSSPTQGKRSILLIHVISASFSGLQEKDIYALAKSISDALPVSYRTRMHLTTAITINPKQLRNFVEKSTSTMTSMVIMVIGNIKAAAPAPSDAKMLKRILQPQTWFQLPKLISHPASWHRGKQPTAQPLLFIILPEPLSSRNTMPHARRERLHAPHTHHSKLIDARNYTQGAYWTFYYQTTVEDVLADLRDTIVGSAQAQAEAHAPSPKLPGKALDEPSIENLVKNKASLESPISSNLSAASPINKVCGGNTSPGGSLPLSREAIYNIMDQLTPHALGLAKPTRGPPKRKTSSACSSPLLKVSVRSGKMAKIPFPALANPKKKSLSIQRDFSKKKESPLAGVPGALILSQASPPKRAPRKASLLVGRSNSTPNKETTPASTRK